MSRITALLFFLMAGMGLSAQQVKKVRGEYTYHAPENVTLEEAKRTALERVKIQLIADEFGTVVAQTNTAFVENTDGQSSVDFQSLGASEVKGEWIETIGAPRYSISYEQDMLVVKVYVEGRIREISATKVDFIAKILCNGTEERFERSDFKNGDELFLSFSSPSDGYLAVYLLDKNNDAYCLLPYQNDLDGRTFINHGEKYIFFSTKKAQPTDDVNSIDEYVMTCENESETNYVYIIFSPNPFSKASDTQYSEKLPRVLNNNDFQKWLAKCRSRDLDMHVVMKQITIHK